MPLFRAKDPTNVISLAKHGVAHTTSVLEKIALLHNGTLQDCCPTLSKGVGQCMPIHGLCKMRKSEHANMAPLHQHTKGWRKRLSPSTMWSMKFGFALMTSNVVWVATKLSMFELAYSTQHISCEDRHQFVKGGGGGVRRHWIQLHKGKHCLLIVGL